MDDIIQLSGFRPKKLGLFLSFWFGGQLSCGSRACTVKRGGFYRPMRGALSRTRRVHGTRGALGTPDLTVLRVVLATQLFITGCLHSLDAKQPEERLEDLANQHKDLWEFHVSFSPGFSVCEWSLSTPVQVHCHGIDFDSSLPEPLGLTTGHLSPPLTLTVSILHRLLSELLWTLCLLQRGPWCPPENLQSAAEGSIRQHPRQEEAVVHQTVLPTPGFLGLGKCIPRAQPRKQIRQIL